MLEAMAQPMFTQCRIHHMLALHLIFQILDNIYRQKHTTAPGTIHSCRAAFLKIRVDKEEDNLQTLH